MDKLSDLEITRSCAEAMGYECVQWSSLTPPKFDSAIAAWHGKADEQPPFNYDPLHDDAQAMALVKNFHVETSFCVGGAWGAETYNVHGETTASASADDLNRAICLCVATLRARK